LAHDDRLETNFVERQQFFGGAALSHGTYDEEKRAAVRLDYVTNMLATDYTLCVRGAGNFSHRYFDTLAAGRFPLLVDTRGGIPFDFLIEWRQCGPVVSAHELHRLPEAVLRFHATLGPSGFQALQMANRRLYERYLSPEGFFAQFPFHFAAQSLKKGR
jgi:hypothetical protein